MSRDWVAMLNARRAGFNEALGLTFVEAGDDGVTATIEVGDAHLQPYGLVHGGVYCAMVETLASAAAAISVRDENRHTVGLENTTSFLRAVREGVLTGRATPLSRGRRSQVWEVAIEDDEGRLVAKGRVRMLVLEDGSKVAGERVGLQAGPEEPRDP